MSPRPNMPEPTADQEPDLAAIHTAVSSAVGSAKLEGAEVSEDWQERVVAALQVPGGVDALIAERIREVLPFDAPDGRPNTDTIYTRCPTCSVVAACGSIEYALVGTSKTMDVSQPVSITCTLAGHRYQATVAEFLPRDAAHACVRRECGASFPVPAIADQVVCPVCRLHQQGPARDEQHAEHLRGVQADYLAGVRTRIRIAKGGGL